MPWSGFNVIIKLVKWNNWVNFRHWDGTHNLLCVSCSAGSISLLFLMGATLTRFTRLQPLLGTIQPLFTIFYRSYTSYHSCWIGWVTLFKTYSTSKTKVWIFCTNYWQDGRPHCTTADTVNMDYHYRHFHQFLALLPYYLLLCYWPGSWMDSANVYKKHNKKYLQKM